jgi:hypothetical protein
MFVYKFRVLLEDQDDFLRDIEIGSKQTFGDFHKALNASVNLEDKALSSFFVCDSKWKKLKEITLTDLRDNIQEPPATAYDEDNVPVPAIPVFVMDHVKIKDMIDDPHQRLIYEHDSSNPRIFYIELLKINEARPEVEYPICVKQHGQLISPVVPFIFETEEVDNIDEKAMLDELNELVDEGQLDTESSDEAPPADIPW